MLVVVGLGVAAARTEQLVVAQFLLVQATGRLELFCTVDCERERVEIEAGVGGQLTQVKIVFCIDAE